MRVREAVLRLSGAGYLALLLSAPVLFGVADLLMDDAAAIGPITAPLTVLLVVTIASIVLWLIYQPHARWDGWTRGWLMLGVVLWLYATVVWRLQGELVWSGSFLLPIALFLILLKRPRSTDVWKAETLSGGSWWARGHWCSPWRWEACCPPGTQLMARSA